MIVTGGLCFWNERPALLEACVRGIANIADRLIAVDGAYARYPGATITSPKRQIDTIKRVARETGLECEVVQLNRLWAGQLEKRERILQLASEDSDWIIPFDADHIIDTDRVAARAALEAMSVNVRLVSVDFFTPKNEVRDILESAATNWHRNVEGTTLRQSHIFRSMSNYRVKKKHWIYEGDWGGGRTEVRFGGAADAWIGVPYVLTHLTLFRSEAEVLASRAFCNDREMVIRLTGQEDDVPGLPEPVWDFDTMPYDYQVPKAVRVMDKQAAFDEPMYRLTLAEAERALKSGFRRILVRVHGAQMQPAIRRDEYVLLEPKPAKVGDVGLGRVRNTLVIAKVAEIGDGRWRLAGEKGLPIGWTREVVGVVGWQGDRWADYVPPEPEPEAEVSLRKDTTPKVEAAVGATETKAEAEVAPKRRGRPPRAAGATPARSGRPRKTAA